MSTIAERHTRLHFKLKAEAAMTTPSLTATAERNLMNAENHVHKLFLRYVETLHPQYRNDHFDPRNRDSWVIGFGEWLAEQQREYIKQFGCSND